MHNKNVNNLKKITVINNNNITKPTCNNKSRVSIEINKKSK